MGNVLTLVKPKDAAGVPPAKIRWPAEQYLIHLKSYLPCWWEDSSVSPLLGAEDPVEGERWNDKCHQRSSKSPHELQEPAESVHCHRNFWHQGGYNKIFPRPLFDGPMKIRQAVVIKLPDLL